MKIVVIFLVIFIPILVNADMIDDALLLFPKVAEDDMQYVQILGSQEKGMVFCLWLTNGSVMTKTIKKGFDLNVNNNSLGLSWSRDFVEYKNNDQEQATNIWDFREKIQNKSFGELLQEGYNLINNTSWTIKTENESRRVFNEEIKLMAIYSGIFHHHRDENKQEFINLLMAGIMRAAKEGSLNLNVEMGFLKQVTNSHEYDNFKEKLKQINKDTRSDWQWDQQWPR